VVIKNKPHAKKYYGAAVAGPVFREVADKLNALYTDRNKIGYRPDVFKKDSSGFYYAGETSDMKFLLNKMKTSYLDSTADSEWSSLYAANYQPVMNGRNMMKQLVPNVKGMGLRDALYMLEGKQLRVLSKGKGKVVRQSPEAGTPYLKNQQVTIELN
jgi:cell division protein FtsI (penicillin-binding protein 3)